MTGNLPYRRYEAQCAHCGCVYSGFSEAQTWGAAQSCANSHPVKTYDFAPELRPKEIADDALHDGVAMTRDQITKALGFATCDDGDCLCRNGMSSRCWERGKRATLAVLDAIREPPEAMVYEMLRETQFLPYRTPFDVMWRALIDALKRREIPNIEVHNRDAQY